MVRNPNVIINRFIIAELLTTYAYIKGLFKIATYRINNEVSQNCAGMCILSMFN